MADDTLRHALESGPQATARALADEWEKVWGSPDTSPLGERARRTIAFLRSLSTPAPRPQEAPKTQAEIDADYNESMRGYRTGTCVIKATSRPQEGEAAELRRLADDLAKLLVTHPQLYPVAQALNALDKAAARLDALEGDVANHDEHAALLTRRIEQEHASFVAELNRKEAAEQRAERAAARLDALEETAPRSPADGGELRRLAERIQGYRDRNAPERPTSLLDDAEDLLRQTAARLDALEGDVACLRADLQEEIEQHAATLQAERKRAEAAEQRASAATRVIDGVDAWRERAEIALRKILSWRERDRDSMPEIFRFIEATASEALAATPRQPEGENNG